MSILIVDDSRVALLLMKQLLADMGFLGIETFESAENVLLHLRKANSREVDAILLDIVLPGMDGIECCRRIRAMSEYVSTPILLVTASDDEEHMKNGFDAGADDYVTKPVKRHELLVRLRLALRLREEMLVRRKYEQRLRDDILVAQEVQRRLLTRHILDDGLRMELLHSPAQNLSGDMVYACRTGQGRHALLLMDVMGHGVAAAFVAVFLQSAAQELFRQDPDPGAVLTALARNMWDLATLSLKDGGPASGVFPAFFTAVCLFIDLENRRLRWCNAGHVPALLSLPGGETLRLESDSPPLGVFPDVKLRSQKMELPEKARLLAFSDGVLDNYFSSPSEGLDWFTVTLQAQPNLDVTGLLKHLAENMQPKRLPEELDDLCLLIADITAKGT